MDWQAFLRDFSQEIIEAEEFDDLPPEALAQKWLGYPGATEEQLQAAEARLGQKLPPSYREFLKTSNGWRCFGTFIYKLWSAEEIDWLRVRNQDLIDIWTDLDEIPVSDAEYFDYSDIQDSVVIRPEYFPHLLEISDWGDSAMLMLNPKVVTPEGEWEAWFFANWLPGARRYPSFGELAQGERDGFKQLLEYRAAEALLSPSDKVLRAIETQVNSFQNNPQFGGGSPLSNMLAKLQQVLAKVRGIKTDSAGDEAAFADQLRDLAEQHPVNRPSSQEMWDVLQHGASWEKLSDLAGQAGSFHVAEMLRRFTGQPFTPQNHAPDSHIPWDFIASNISFDKAVLMFLTNWQPYSLVQQFTSTSADPVGENILHITALNLQHAQDEVALFNALQAYHQQLQALSTTSSLQGQLIQDLGRLLNEYEEVEE